MEHKLSRITERVVKISDDPPFVRKFLPYLGTEEELSKSSHAHLIHVDLPGGTCFLHGWFITANDPWLKNEPCWKREVEVGPRHDLVDIIRKGAPRNFDQLLQVLSFFLYSGKHDMTRLPVKRYVSDGSVANQVLNSILSKSQGWLLWSHQADRIFAIFERNSGIRRDLLHDFRLRRGSSERWMKSKRFNDGRCLSEVIEQRYWVRAAVAEPPVSFAFRLYNFLFSNESAAASDQGGHKNN